MSETTKRSLLMEIRDTIREQRDSEFSSTLQKEAARYDEEAIVATKKETLTEGKIPSESDAMRFLKLASEKLDQGMDKEYWAFKGGNLVCVDQDQDSETYEKAIAKFSVTVKAL